MVADDYARVIERINPSLGRAQSAFLARRVIAESNDLGIDPRLVVAIVATESGWHITARSPVGAMGLGQLMPGTASALGVDPMIAQSNLHGAMSYFAGLLFHYRKLRTQARYEHAIAAYNAGPSAVDRYNGIPPYAETRNYVQTVIRRWLKLCGRA